MTVKGEIEEIGEVNYVSDKFRKREFVVKTTEKYPQYIKMVLTQDKCEMLDNVQIGSRVLVNFELRGRKSEKNGAPSYFTNIEAWKVERV